MSGESHKELIKGEQSFREQIEREKEDKQVGQAERQAKLERALQELDMNIEAITKSIAELVTRIQEGKALAAKSGNEGLAALHSILEEEAQAKKNQLLKEKEVLEAGRQKLAAELGALGAN
jgi:hypothetical protein